MSVKVLDPEPSAFKRLIKRIFSPVFGTIFVSCLFQIWDCNFQVIKPQQKNIALSEKSLIKIGVLPLAKRKTGFDMHTYAVYPGYDRKFEKFQLSVCKSSFTFTTIKLEKPLFFSFATPSLVWDIMCCCLLPLSTNTPCIFSPCVGQRPSTLFVQRRCSSSLTSQFTMCIACVRIICIRL